MSGQESETRYDAWLRYVNDHVRLVESGKSILPGSSSEPLPTATSAAAGQPLRVVLCSPHPDDEALTGALPLRLRQELGATVTNCAITLGSDVQRREGRLRELESSCRVLGFDVAIPQEPGGFDSVSVQTRTERPEAWAAMVRALSDTFERLQPDVVFAPHAEDWHPAHVGTHFLAVDALSEFSSRTKRGVIPLIETSYWHEHAQPNLMVGVSPENLAMLVMATAEHAGEVSRNPYHLRLPSRMIENVRRGAETVGGVGGSAPDFPFAELYRVTFMKGKQQIPPRPGGIIIGPAEKIDWAAVLDQFRPPEL
jgi:LmbE family N-acetylglucosaminyl deacetylase